MIAGVGDIGNSGLVRLPEIAYTHQAQDVTARCLPHTHPPLYSSLGIVPKSTTAIINACFGGALCRGFRSPPKGLDSLCIIAKRLSRLLARDYVVRDEVLPDSLWVMSTRYGWTLSGSLSLPLPSPSLARNLSWTTSKSNRIRADMHYETGVSCFAIRVTDMWPRLPSLRL